MNMIKNELSLFKCNLKTDVRNEFCVKFHVKLMFCL